MTHVLTKSSKFSMSYELVVLRSRRADSEIAVQRPTTQMSTQLRCPGSLSVLHQEDEWCS